MQHVKVPQDRIGVPIGEGGSTLREIESRAEVQLDVGSENGSTAIDNASGLVLGIVAPDMVRAVDRGFAPEDAMTPLDDDVMMFELVDIDRRTRNKDDMRWQKGRLIGENGHTHELMEELTGADVIVYGTMPGVIGQPEKIEVVRRAAEMILDGAPHGAVCSSLERKHNGLTQGFNIRRNNWDATADESTPTRHDTRPYRLFTAPASGLARPPGESHR